MPELPDVEGTRRYLLKQGLAGRHITQVSLESPKVVARPTADAFVAALTGQRVNDVRRRAKFLALPLADGPTLLIHLRMTGVLILPTKARRCRIGLAPYSPSTMAASCASPIAVAWGSSGSSCRCHTITSVANGQE